MEGIDRATVESPFMELSDNDSLLEFNGSCASAKHAVEEDNPSYPVLLNSSEQNNMDSVQHTVSSSGQDQSEKFPWCENDGNESPVLKRPHRRPCRVPVLGGADDFNDVLPENSSDDEDLVPGLCCKP